MKKHLGLFCVAGVVLAAAAAFGGVGFTGKLVVRCDSGDTLPVYIDGLFKGKTPLVIEEQPVGTYQLSFMAPLVRDSILRSKKVDLPKGYQKMFKGVDAVTVARLSQVNVTVKNHQTSEAEFPIKDVLQAVRESNRSQIIKIVALGGVLALVFTALALQAF
jgi:hypothetical protein